MKTFIFEQDFCFSPNSGSIDFRKQVRTLLRHFPEMLEDARDISGSLENLLDHVKMFI